MQVVGSAASDSSTAITITNNSIEEEKGGPTDKPAVGNRAVSSNVYANGSSQNTGNVITDRPTSRVTQPPGGKSSVCLG